MTVEERIRRGIALLDKRRPAWRKKVDVKKLDQVT